MTATVTTTPVPFNNNNYYVIGSADDPRNMNGAFKMPEAIAQASGATPKDDYILWVDKENGNIRIRQHQPGAIWDKDIGTYNPETNEISFNPAPWPAGPTDAQKKLFTNQEALKVVKTNAATTGEKSRLEENPDMNQDDAKNEARDAVSLGENEDNLGTQDTAQISEVNPGTRKDFGKGFTYPSTLDPKKQDTIHFSMLEYSPKTLTNKAGLMGSGDRKDRKSIGSVTLPIPNGIKDSDKVEWGADNMDAATMAMASIALETISQEGSGKAELNKVLGGMKGIMKGNMDSAFASAFGGAAVGKDKGKFMSRATGQIMNPNMELLFGGPSLREFSFTFLLAPREHKEAMDVMRIIRFFKQGMLPIRSKSNLFLKAPHTFQLTYKTKDSNHPYLNSFKECALRSCDVNYTPENSYSTYTDSVMTAYSLSLTFSELEPIYNDDYGKTTDFPASLLFESEGSSKTPGTTDYNPDSGYAPGYGPKDDEGTSVITGKPIDTSKGGSFI